MEAVRTIGFALFETDAGCCGVSWSARGVTGVQLPEGDAERTRARLKRRFPEAEEGAPPGTVQDAIGRIAALFRGEAADLSRVALDVDDVPRFERRVYEVAREIPPGETLTYGEVAARLEGAGDARAVGTALGRNPFPVIVPCHRVVAAGGKTGGFSARGGVATKLKLLEMERAHAGSGLPLFDEA